MSVLSTPAIQSALSPVFPEMSLWSPLIYAVRASVPTTAVILSLCPSAFHGCAPSSVFWEPELPGPGKGNGTPFQYSCLENPMDRGAWKAAVHGVAKSRPIVSRSVPGDPEQLEIAKEDAQAENSSIILCGARKIQYSFRVAS